MINNRHLMEHRLPQYPAHGCIYGQTLCAVIPHTFSHLDNLLFLLNF